MITTYEAQVTTKDRAGGAHSDAVNGEDPRVIAAWLRAQADRLDPPRRPMRGMSTLADRAEGGIVSGIHVVGEH